MQHEKNKEHKVYQLSLATIRCVREVMTRKNLTETAKSLGISQPAVSQHVARVEQTLGYPVIVRHGNDIVVRAKELKPIFDKILDGAHGLVKAQKGNVSGYSRPSLGISSLIAEGLFADIQNYVDLSKRYNIVVSSSQALVEMFQDAQIDLIFRVMNAEEEDADLMLSDTSKWVSNAEFNQSLFTSLQRNAPISIVLGPDSSNFSKNIEASLVASKINYDVAARVAPSSLRVSLAAAGVGYTFVPSFLVKYTDLNGLSIATQLSDISDIRMCLNFHKKVIKYREAFDLFEHFFECLGNSDYQTPGAGQMTKRL